MVCANRRQRCFASDDDCEVGDDSSDSDVIMFDFDGLLTKDPILQIIWMLQIKLDFQTWFLLKNTVRKQAVEELLWKGQCLLYVRKHI